MRHQNVRQPIESLTDRVVLVKSASLGQFGHLGETGRHFGEHAAAAAAASVAVGIAVTVVRCRRTGQPHNGAHLGHILGLGVRPSGLLIGQPLQLGHRTEHGAHRLATLGQPALVLQRQRHIFTEHRKLVRLADGSLAQAIMMIGSAVGEEGEEENVGAQDRVFGDDAQPALQAAATLLEQRVDH